MYPKSKEALQELKKNAMTAGNGLLESMCKKVYVHDVVRLLDWNNAEYHHCFIVKMQYITIALFQHWENDILHKPEDTLIKMMTLF